MWLQQSDQLLRILTIGLPIYLLVIVLLRLTGARSLTKMNAFDTVVSVALGSALAAAIMTLELPGALAAATILLLIGLQFAIAWLSVRIPLIHRLTRSSPKLLLLDGRILEDDLRRARLTLDAVRAAVRAHGKPRIEEIFAVVLETDGSLSVIADRGTSPATALKDVDGIPSHHVGR